MAYFPLSSGSPSIPGSPKLYHLNTVLEPANSTPSSKGKASPPPQKREDRGRESRAEDIYFHFPAGTDLADAEPWGRGQAVSDREEQAPCQAVMSLSAQAGKGEGGRSWGTMGGELGGETDRAERAAGR